MKPKKKKASTDDQKLSLVVSGGGIGNFIWQPPEEIANYLMLSEKNLAGLTEKQTEMAKFGAESMREDVKLIISLQLMHIGQIVLLSTSHKGRPLDAPMLLNEIKEQIILRMNMLNVEFESR